MANALYDNGRDKFANGAINWPSDTIKAILIDTALYTVNLSTHANLSDVAAGSRVGAATALAGKSTAAGVCDANDLSITGLTSAPTIEAIILFKDTGVEASSTLIAYIDNATGLPTPAGASRVDITWDNGGNKIFKL